ncbi:MAG: hypothetical protein IID43_04250 [Planctomycetes bacterium]|nr:hypothetical protein [Planctomycetota bacterium]
MDAEAKPDPLERMLGQPVVLDTATPVIYLGTLIQVTDTVLVLDGVDMHDFCVGHAQKEMYLAEASRDGISVNRRNIVVLRSAVISVSRLADVVAD